jgi:hypothetical protein
VYKVRFVVVNGNFSLIGEYTSTVKNRQKLASVHRCVWWGGGGGGLKFLSWSQKHYECMVWQNFSSYISLSTECNDHPTTLPANVLFCKWTSLHSTDTALRHRRTSTFKNSQTAGMDRCTINLHDFLEQFLFNCFSIKTIPFWPPWNV